MRSWLKPLHSGGFTQTYACNTDGIVHYIVLGVTGGDFK